MWKNVAITYPDVKNVAITYPEITRSKSPIETLEQVIEHFQS